jgi:hypothetical protein
MRRSARGFTLPRMPKEDAMHAQDLQKTAEAGDWPVIANIIVPIAEWWRRRAAVRNNLASLNAFDAEDMARMARDVGVSASELRALAGHCSDAADLLDRRLEALGLSAKELAHTAPAELRDMERLCTMCESKGRCGRDLAADSSDPVWRQYCPNEPALMSLARAGIKRSAA